MDKFLKTLLFSCMLVSVFVSSSAQTCNDHRLSTNNLYTSCNDLPVLNSFLHWTYHQANNTADIAYRHTGITSSRWVAWALNINGRGMVGAQSLVAFRNSSGEIHAFMSPISDYSTTMAAGDLSFNVPQLRAEFENNEMVILATIELPNGSTSFNQVWQEGPVSGDTLGRHTLTGANMISVGTVDFATGQTSGGGGGGGSGGGPIIPRLQRKNVHGVLNVVSWGILLPLGAVIARYLKVFKSADPAWFYLHVTCQSSAYIVGVAGWATGLSLGSDSPTLQFNTHRNIGIALFCLGTLQVFALLLRPKVDHKYRFYWNIYHYAVGYTVIILSIVNIFEGFDILRPDKKWKNAYIGVLIFLGAVAAILEAFTWYIVIKRKKAGSDKNPHVGNGVNGYSARSQQAV